MEIVVWDFKLLNATQTLEKTMAYVMYRLVMYLILSLFLVIAMLLGSGTGLMMGSMAAAGAEPITLATQGGGEGEVGERGARAGAWGRRSRRRRGCCS